MVNRSILASLLALALLVPVTVNTAAQLVPEDAEPVLLSKPLDRGGVEEHGPAIDDEPSAKTVDGDPSDWVGEASRLGGTAVLDHGEWIYQDFVFDDWGADDGLDAQRLEQLGPAYQQERRLERLEALGQAGEEQFGGQDADPTGGAIMTPANYGDAVYPAGTAGHADIVETRLGADAEDVHLLVRFATMIDQTAPALYLQVDAGASPPGETDPFHSGLSMAPGFTPVFIDATGVYAGSDAEAVEGATVAVDPSGSTNAMEVRIPRTALTPPDDPDALSLGWFGAGISDTASPTPQLADVTPDQDAGNLVDLIFQPEAHVSNWMDRGQALALVDPSAIPSPKRIDLAPLEAGTTQPFQPTPGYHERVFLSSPEISTEEAEQGPKDGRWQHYGLYLPHGLLGDTPSWALGADTPLTMWLHWRGGTAHQAPAWTPRVVEQLGQERSPPNIVISPYARGTGEWYLGQGHVDVLEVLEDVHAFLPIDEDRRYVSGYSMGGFGSYLFGMLYPDLFAAAYPISGPITHGAWAGIDEGGRDTITDEGNARPNDALLSRIAVNANNVPYVIHHGSNDELVPITGVQRMASLLAQEGYRYRMYTFPGYEHFTQAIVDEWAEGARYLDEHERDPEPTRVVYRRVPAIEQVVEEVNADEAELSFTFDGAFWLDGLAVREDEPVTSQQTRTWAEADVRVDGHREPVLVPEAGAAAPGHSTPFAMHGLAWLDDPTPCDPSPLCTPAGNSFEGALTNAASVELDVAGMGLDPGQPLSSEAFSTDGQTTLRLDGGWTQPPSVTVDGAPSTASLANGVLSIPLDEGTHTLEVTP